MNEENEMFLTEEEAKRIVRNFYIACFATVVAWAFCISLLVTTDMVIAPVLIAVLFPLAMLKGLTGESESTSVKAAKAAVGFYAGYKGGGGLT